MVNDCLLAWAIGVAILLVIGLLFLSCHRERECVNCGDPVGEGETICPKCAGKWA